MYFVLVIGTLELMRWMAFAGNCLAGALLRRLGIIDARSEGPQQIR
jgi:hypothetical protein